MGGSYRINESVDLLVAYLITDMEYERGEGLERFGFDAKIHGPSIGLRFRF